VLMALLFGPALVAVYFVGRNGYTGGDIAKPFKVAGLTAFGLAGILLMAALITADMRWAANFAIAGAAAFGGAISCGVTALVVWYREQRKLAAERRQRPWPHQEDL